MELMDALYQLRAEIKEQWLDYVKQNRSWIERLNQYHKLWQMTEEEIEPEVLEALGENWHPARPDSYIILTAVTALNPKVTPLLAFLSEIQPDANQLVQGLGLDFDPLVELKRRELHRQTLMASEETFRRYEFEQTYELPESSSHE